MKIYAIVDGVEYDLNYGDPATFEGEDGLGMPDLHRLAESGPFQHGNTDRGYRLDPRYPAYVFGISAWTRSQFWERRQELLEIFRPSRPIIMKHVLDNGDVRYLDCLFTGGMKMPAQDRKGGTFQKVAIALVANDPTFYDPIAVSWTVSFDFGPHLGEVPSPIPMLVGTDRGNKVFNPMYYGSWISYPFIRLFGPIHDAIITNETTSEVLDFTGATIAAGHYYDIDCRYGIKSVLLDGITNKIGDLTSASDLATFHLAENCINTFRITGLNIDANTKYEMSYFERYLGI